VISGDRYVCCDLSQVAFLGAAAVNTFFAALAAADDARRVFTVRGVNGLGVHVFQVTGLAAVLASRA
jgi:anti-anti-sigma regulatory factor